ncbi:hypothetical protein BD410DRAFT_793562 [Rickenella mellea]|uniref:Uncharacterized protein n=1 Tax=Rickenella mellea TaxID=50990 RepID=A0A4Y7PT54_9AGAM|nr:hypothetical protein BD410DRAFT_793562 [Rickenella mellea]
MQNDHDMQAEQTHTLVAQTGVENSNCLVGSDGTAQEHPSYFFKLVVFLVEGTLFRLPRILFEEQSSVFRDMFLLPPPGHEGGEEGTSSTNPIRLDGVKKSDFESFLGVLVPQALNPSRPEMTMQDWLRALKVAGMWEFASVRHTVIEALDHFKLTDVEKIIVDRDYDVPEWKMPAYTGLAMRKKALTADEMRALGLEFSERMNQVREDVIRDGRYKYNDERFCHEAVARVFGVGPVPVVPT